MLTPSYKQKLPKYLSWTVGAEIISDELASVPQIEKLKLIFFYHSSAGDSKIRPKPIQVIEIMFRHLHRDLSSSDKPEYKGWADENWEIWVRPVPRELKHEIKQLLLSEGFSKIREWLSIKRNPTWSEGRKSFTVLYDHMNHHLIYEVDSNP